MISYAAHCKSYDVIILVPVAVAACFGLFSSTTNTNTNTNANANANAIAQVRWIDSSPQWRRSEALMLAGWILLAAANLAVYSYHSRTVVSFYEPAAVKEVTSIWVNISGPISSRLTKMAFNFVRFLVIILLYPFSTYLKQPPRLPDDYLFGLGSFGFVLGGEQRVAMGAFTLMRRIHEDSAIFSKVIHIAILIVVLAGADRFAASAFRS